MCGLSTEFVLFDGDLLWSCMGCLVCFMCACFVYVIGCCVCEILCDVVCCSYASLCVCVICLMCLCGLFAIHCVMLYGLRFCVFDVLGVRVLLLFLIMCLNVLIVSDCVVVVFVSVFLECVCAFCL